MGVPSGTPDEDRPAWQRHAESWNRMVAQSFVHWLAPPPGLTWLNTNCGDGTLAREIAARAAPARLLATDPSEDNIRRAWQGTPASRVSFHQAQMSALPFPPGAFDRAVCALGAAGFSDVILAQLRHVLRPRGEVALWAWDRDGGMQPRDSFRHAAELPLGGGMSPLSAVEIMARLGFGGIASRAIDVPILLPSFDAYWALFQEGNEPEAAHCRVLDMAASARLRDRLRGDIAMRADGSIAMIARAWGIRGIAR